MAKKLIIHFLKQGIYLLCGVLIVIQASAMNNSYAKQSGNLQNTVISSQRTLPLFSAIDAQGNFRLIITTTPGRQTVKLTANAAAVNNVTTEVRNRTLILRIGPQKELANARILVQIEMASPLVSLAVGGSSEARLVKARSSGLSIYVYDQAIVRINGAANVQRIRNDGAGVIDIGDINSPNLIIGGNGNGRIFVNGTTDVLTAHLEGSLCLEAEHLLAKKVYVQTQDESLAEVLPKESLYAFSSDTSNIYYYRVPQEMVRSTQDSGNVLPIINRN